MTIESRFFTSSRCRPTAKPHWRSPAGLRPPHHRHHHHPRPRHRRSTSRQWASRRNRDMSSSHGECRTGQATSQRFSDANPSTNGRRLDTSRRCATSWRSTTSRPCRGIAMVTALERGPSPSLEASSGWTFTRPPSLAGATPDAMPVHELSLADGTPAVLALHDIAGRRLWSRDVSSLGPGPHSLSMDLPAGFPSGLYFLELHQGTRSLNAKVVLSR